MLLFVACPVLQNFTNLFHKQQDFRKEVIEQKTKFLKIFSTTLVETFLILVRTEGNMVLV